MAITSSMDSNRSSEASCPAYLSSPTVLAIWCTILCVLLIFAVIGNGVVISTLLRTWNTAGTKSGNILAIVLASCDLLHSVINTIFILTVAALSCVPPTVIKIQFGLLVLLAGGSNMTLCVIAFNRYYFVAKPNTNDKTARHRMKQFLVLAWGFVMTVAFLCVVLFDVGTETRPEVRIPNDVSMMMALCLVVILPIVIMAVTYFRLLRLVKMRCRPTACSSRPAPEVNGHRPNRLSNTISVRDGSPVANPGRCSTEQVTSNARKTHIEADAPSIFGATTAPNKIIVRQQKLMQSRPPDIRIAVTMLILLGVFILCWTPAIILAIGATARIYDLFNPVVFAVVTVAIFIVPACNPIVYSLRNSQFRTAANEFLHSLVNSCRRSKPNRAIDEP